MRTAFVVCARWISFGAIALLVSFWPLRAHADAPAAQLAAQAPVQPAVPAKPVDQAAQLVQKALMAEADGKPDMWANFLQQALAVAPDFAPAHWQSGEIRDGDRWTSIDDAAKQDAHSAKLDEYRKLRDAAGATVDEQLNLARWCEKAGLKDQERAHLMFALQLQPNNKEAISKLGLVRYRAELVPKDQLEQVKANLKQSTAESREWHDKVATWAKQLKEQPATEHAEVLKQIAAVRDPHAIPAMEQMLGPISKEACIAVVDALAGMPQQAATESLLRAAVFSEFDEVRRDAVYALKTRSIYSYVPLLLSALRMPIEVRYEVLQFDSYSFVHQMALYRRGPDQDDEYINYQKTHLTSAPITNPNHPGIDGAAEMIQGVKQQQIGNAIAVVQNVDRINQQSATFNSVLAQVLQDTTGNDLGNNPTSWWDWWFDQNEYYEPPQQPVNLVSRAQSVSAVIHRSDCFVAGTPVWTVSGPMQIEKIKVGELVLAENIETGELAYKPVVDALIRPSGPLIEIHLGERVIRCAKGHPFWVDGKGWQMAKELKAGQWLHTAHGPVQIDSAEPTDEAVCYNLVVADFHDYFVSDAKVLVHDNLLRGPTLATVPGLAEAK